VELYRAAKVFGIFDFGIRSAMHEFRSQRRYALAGHVPAGSHENGGQVFRVVPQAAQIGIGLSKTQDDMRPTVVKLDIFTLTDDRKIPLQVGQRVHQGVRSLKLDDAKGQDIGGESPCQIDPSERISHSVLSRHSHLLARQNLLTTLVYNVSNPNQ
jgi:hypothetical protein